MNISTKNIVILFFLALFLFNAPAVKSRQNKAREKFKKIRVLVMDFETKEINLTKNAKYISSSFRRFFTRNKKFATIDINIINQLMISRKQKLQTEKERSTDLISALYIGNRLRTHKIIIGYYSKENSEIELIAEMVDVAAGNSELKMKLETKESKLKEKLPPFIQIFSDKMLGIVKEQREEAENRKERKKNYYFYPKVSLYSGAVTGLGDIKEYLKPSFIVMIKCSVDVPFIPWTTLDINSGYSRFSGKNIVDGNAKQNFIPIFFSLTFSYPFFKHPWIPNPVLIAGAGVTYLELEKKQSGDTASEKGLNATFVAGLGLRYTLRSKYYFQLEGNYHYIYENTYVGYFYGGLRVGMIF